MNVSNEVLVKEMNKQLVKLIRKNKDYHNTMESIATKMTGTKEIAQRVLDVQMHLAENDIKSVESGLLETYKDLNRNYFNRVTKGLHLETDSAVYKKDQLISNNFGETLIYTYAIEYYINKRLVTAMVLDTVRFIVRIVEPASNCINLIKEPTTTHRLAKYIQDILESEDIIGTIISFEHLDISDIKLLMYCTSRTDIFGTLREVILNCLNKLKNRVEANENESSKTE